MRYLITCFLFSALMVPTSALPFTIRAVNRDGNDISVGVIKGIVVGILALITIPLLWYAYKMCNRRRPSPTYLFAPSPPMFTNTTPNGLNMPPSSSNIARPHPAHTRVNAPTHGA